MGEVGHDFIRGRLQRLDTDELFIEYQRKVVPTPWRESSDWGSNPETESAVSRIVGLLNSGA